MVENVVPTKKLLFERLLGEHEVVQVVLDARADGVEVPGHLREEMQLRLNLSRHYGLPLTVDDSAIEATLTFSGTRHVVRLPWSSIYLMLSDDAEQARLFPEDVPTELLERAEAETAAQAESPQPGLRLIEPLPDDESDANGSAPDEPPPAAPKRGHLRLVK